MIRILPRLTMAALLLVAAPAGAQQTAERDSVALDARTREVSAQLRCPVCQGESIKDSPAPLAQEMRQVVREQLAAGKSPDEVKRYFVAKYGEWILLRPQARGFNLLVYALPFGALLAGALVVTLAVRRWTRGGGAESEEQGAESSSGP